MTLSRAAIAIVFAAMRRMTATMMTPIEVTRSLTFPTSDMNDIWNAFSVSVFVGYGEFSNIPSIVSMREVAALASRALIQTMPSVRAEPRRGLLEVLPVEVQETRRFRRGAGRWRGR